MTREEFISALKSTAPVSKSKMIETCQYYIDNYTLNIQEGVWIPYPLKINGGSDGAVYHAFMKLKSRVNEF